MPSLLRRTTIVRKSDTTTIVSETNGPLLEPATPSLSIMESSNWRELELMNYKTDVIVVHSIRHSISSSFIHFCQSIISLSINPLTHSPVHSLIHPSIYSLNQSLTHSTITPPIHLLILLSTHIPSHSPIHSFNGLLTRPPIYSPT